MPEYVIYLSSELRPKEATNSYGYWKGKTYTLRGDIFPKTWDVIDSDIKRYTSKKRAENMAEKLAEKCTYVLSWIVEEI